MAFSFHLPPVPTRTNTALVVVWPFKHKYTWGTDPDPAWAVEVEDKPLFIPHLISVSTQESKANHTSSARVVFKDTEGLDYRMSPSDWMAIWMFDNKEDASRVEQAIANKKQANDFSDGLKFLGRVGNFARSVTTDPSTGTQTKTTMMTGIGFGEFDSKVYYDPAVPMLESFPLQWARLTDLYKATTTKLDFSSGSMISKLLTIFLGDGPGLATKGSSDLPRVHNSQFIIPTVVAQTLGTQDRDEDSSLFTYSSLLHTYIGVQKYSSQEDTSTGIRRFLPDSVVPAATRFDVGSPLTGLFGPQVTAWAGVPIWSILNQYLNPAINEIYTCLRVNFGGEVVPTLVVRQIPFTTPTFQTSNESSVTRFFELPRWLIDIKDVMQMDTAKADNTHSNFIHITNQSPQPGGPSELALQRARVPPASDINDIYRSGLRPVLQTTNTMPLASQDINIKFGPAMFWTEVAADRMMGFHLRWGGQITTKGILYPICVGDNLQILDIVYHIESVSHTMTVQSNGMSMFNTTLQVSSGVPDPQYRDTGDNKTTDRNHVTEAA